MRYAYGDDDKSSIDEDEGNETGERDQTVDDGDLAGGSLAPDAAFVPAAEMNKAVLYARRLMGASRRIH